MPSAFSNYEEPVRLLCERFEEACRRNGFSGEVDRKLAREWATGARDWIEAIGENWALLDAAVDEMRSCNPPLIVASPRSCIKVARDMSMWQQETPTELVELFSNLTRLPVPSGRNDWSQPLVEISKMCGSVESAKKLITEVVKKMRNDKLTITGPQSILNLCKATVAQGIPGESASARWARENLR